MVKGKKVQLVTDSYFQHKEVIIHIFHDTSISLLAAHFFLTQHVFLVTAVYWVFYFKVSPEWLVKLLLPPFQNSYQIYMYNTYKYLDYCWLQI